MNKAEPKLMVSSQARVLDFDDLLFEFGKAWGETMREVYMRVVIHKEPWFVVGGGGMRGELIRKGWSQREATSLLRTAQAAQTGAVESTKLALQNTKDRLKEVKTKISKLQTAKEFSKKGGKPTSEWRGRNFHGLCRRRDKLESKVVYLEKLLADDGVRVCFGSKPLAKAGNAPAAHGYTNHMEWQGVWKRARAGMYFCEGDREARLGNYSAQVLLGHDGAPDFIRLRIPSFLRHLSNGQERVSIPVRGFANHRKSLLLAQARTFVGDKLVNSLHLERNLCLAPISLRLTWNEGQQHWYATASVEEYLPGELEQTALRTLGVDINPTHLSLCLLNRHGNPLQFLDIPLDLTGNQKQNLDVIGIAMRKVVEYALANQATIAHETLDFSRARKSLRYECSSKTAKLLSSFAFRAILTTLDRRAWREGVKVISVHPAWTSVLGQVNYAGIYGISVDQGAACAIGRRALGFSELVRPWFLERLAGNLAVKSNQGSQGQTATASRPQKGLPPRSEAVGQVHYPKKTPVGTLMVVGKALRSGVHTPGRDQHGTVQGCA